MTYDEEERKPGQFTMPDVMFGTSGELHEWMHHQKLVHVAGNTLMVHSGISKALTSLTIDEINGQVKSMIADESHWLNEAQGPCREDGLATGRETPELCADLDYILNHYGVERMIVGHTPQKDHRIRDRCGGRLILADIDITRGGVGGVELIKTDGTYVAWATDIDGRRQVPLLPKITPIPVHATEERIIDGQPCSSAGRASVPFGGFLSTILRSLAHH